MTTEENNVKHLLHRIHIDDSNFKKIIQEDYLSKLEERKRFKCYPSWNVARNTPEARLVKKQRELIFAQKELENKLNNLKLKRTSLDSKWQEIQSKQKELYESFIKFDTFIKDSQDIKIRSKLHIKKETERHTQLKLEIEKIRTTVEEYKQLKAEIEDNFQKYQIYPEFLERIVNETDSFKSVQDILNYFDNLVEATKVLNETIDNKLANIKNIETERHEMIETKSKKIIDLNKKLAKLQDEYDKSKARVQKWESTVSRVKDAVVKRKLELIRVRASCWNMYEQICKKHGADRLKSSEDREDLEKQIKYIKIAIAEQKQVLEDVKKKFSNSTDIIT